MGSYQDLDNSVRSLRLFKKRNDEMMIQQATDNMTVHRNRIEESKKTINKNLSKIIREETEKCDEYAGSMFDYVVNLIS